MEPFFDAKIWVKPKWSHPLKEEVKHQWKRERCPGRSFLDSGFDGRDYNFPDFEGTFEAEMVCKRWDKNSKLLVYLDFDDGRKIITSAWQDSNYKGLADVPFNTRVRVTFQYSKKGISYLRSAEVI